MTSETRTPVPAATARPGGPPGPPGTPLRADPNTVLAVLWIGAAAVLLLWWHDTPAIHSLGDWLTNAGRITGLLAGYLVVVLLALMARVPALERGVGTDRLARWHAMLGRYTVCLVLAHSLLIIWGYAVTAHQGVVGQTWTLLTSYPDVLMATVALGLLVAVGISSARAARRRLRYETWHFVHLYTYLAIALAFSHQFATGADFMHNRPARVLWSAMYLAVGGTLVWYRLLTPLLRAYRHQLRVVRVDRESVDTISVWITGRQLHRLGAEPGQFFRWRFLTRQLWWAGNPYSLSAVPTADYLRITVKGAGEHSRLLAELRPGTRVLAEGPFGAFPAGRRRRQRVLLLAGGVGITPIRALFESLPGAAGDITLIYRAHSQADVVFAPELEWIAQHRGARLLYVFGERGR
ncbi:MAG TPA: ferric reductase-like transmembrane domain-containing protein, partial [Jatrophihabitans sp.]|nr:ferric reductase-like transmembrane domain-containing protein [Jatrophihabitans sp.]